MPLIDARDSVLVIIDAQPGFYRERSDVDTAVLATFIATVAWLAAVAAACEVPAVVTVERAERNGPTADAITSALAPGTPVLPKTVFGVTGNDEIRAAIEGTGRRTAVLIGMETDVCVAHSAIGLLDDGYRVATVVDALFAPGSAHDFGLERMRAAGVELTSAKGLYYEWLPSVTGVQRFKSSHPSLNAPPGFHL